MQTTLRIDDDLYRRAKIEAAREGITLTQFIQEALDLRLQTSPKSEVVQLPTYRGASKLPASFDLIEAMDKAEKTADEARAKRLLKSLRPRQ